MLIHPTIAHLESLRLFGMAAALTDQIQTSASADLPFEERLALLVDREVTERNNRRLRARLRKARLRQDAAIENLDLRHPRGLDKALVLSLASCQWITDRLNVIITGPTGVGKSYLACALAQKACREGHSAIYHRLPRLLHELTIARCDGRYGKLLHTLAKTDLLVLDDWGLAPLPDDQRRDLLELVDDRHGSRSTIITSQLPLDLWHQAIGDPTLADAILDRLVHNAYHLNLKGDSMRKTMRKLTQTGHQSI